MVEVQETVLERIEESYAVGQGHELVSESVEFDSYTMWIHKATFIPVEVKFEKGGVVYRTVNALKVEDVVGAGGASYKTVTQSRMTDENIGGNTLLEYTSVQYDIGLEEETFTERFLRNPPRKHLD